MIRSLLFVTALAAGLLSPLSTAFAGPGGQSLLNKTLPPPLLDPSTNASADTYDGDALIPMDPAVDFSMSPPTDYNNFGALTSTVESYVIDPARFSDLKVERMALPLKAGNLSVSVASALRKTGLPFEEALRRALSSDAFPRQVDNGDTVDLRVSEDADGNRIVVGLELQLASEPAPLRMYRYQPEGSNRPQFFDGQGYEFETSIIDSPMRYIGISSFLGDGRHHKGLDLRAPVGTPIRTPYRGVVERVNWYMATQGLCVQILYVDLGIRAKFFHLSKIDADIQPGVELAAGEYFSLSGNTGRSTGPHLHYQLEDAETGAILNPIEVHGMGSPRLIGEDQSMYASMVAAIETLPAERDDVRSARAEQSTPATEATR